MLTTVRIVAKGTKRLGRLEMRERDPVRCVANGGPRSYPDCTFARRGDSLRNGI
jgi:hypothetical protein